MKLVTERCGQFAKLGVAAIVLSLSQFAFAVGTPSGNTISNLATVDYDVNGTAQTEIESAPGVGNSTPGFGVGTTTDFTVDTRVNFTLDQVGTAHTTVSPGETGALTEFLITNTGNATQDYRLVATNLPDGSVVNTLTDNSDMTLPVALADNNDNSTPEPGTDDPFVDSLGADLSRTIWISADADLMLVNGNIANVNLEGISADAGSCSAACVDSVSTPGGDTPGVDTVVAVGGTLDVNNANAQDGYQVASSALFVSKDSLLLSDPFNGALNPKHIPQAVVQYTVTIDNTGGTLDADDVVVTDTLTDVTLSSDITIAGASTGSGTCTGDDAVDTDGDGCSYDPISGLITVGDAVLRIITVAQTTTATITFEVTID